MIRNLTDMVRCRKELFSRRGKKPLRQPCGLPPPHLFKMGRILTYNGIFAYLPILSSLLHSNGEVAAGTADGGVMTPKKRPQSIRMARQQRKEMSPTELFLWQHLRQEPEGLRFRRNHPFGPFAFDFYHAKAKLAFEIDGIAHDMGDQPERDIKRDAYAAAHGVETVRIAAKDVLQNSRAVADAVVRVTLAKLGRA